MGNGFFLIKKISTIKILAVFDLAMAAAAANAYSIKDAEYMFYCNLVNRMISLLA